MKTENVIVDFLILPLTNAGNNAPIGSCYYAGDAIHIKFAAGWKSKGLG